MNRSSRSSRVILSVSGLLIVLLFFLSVDKHRVSYEQWKDSLAKLRLASQELDSAILKIRGGLRVDYDQLVEKEALLQKFFAALGQTSSVLPDGNSNTRFSGIGELVNQKHINLPTDNLAGLITEKIELVERFKSNFSVLRNSQLITFQLINDARSKYADRKHLIEDLNLLERIVLHVIRFPDDHYREKMESQLQSIQTKYKGKDSKEIDAFISFALNHFRVIISREKIIKSSLQSGVSLSEQTEHEINILDNELTNFHQVKSKISTKFSYAFVVVAIFILLFGAIQSRRSYTLAKQLKGQNETLEGLVSVRTKHLESAKNNLQQEKHEREEIMLALDDSRKRLDMLINHIPGCVYEYDIESKKINYINRRVKEIWGLPIGSVDNVNLLQHAIHPEDITNYISKIDTLISKLSPLSSEFRVIRPDDSVIWAKEISAPISTNGKIQSIVSVAVDITEFKQAGEEKRRMKEELIQSQKLESVGQLAAGVAHEINTPAQFISDNLLFLQESVGDILQLVKDLESKAKAVEHSDLTEAVDNLLEHADMEYLAEEVPPALKQSYEGISRIAKIVRAMKDYSHPGEAMEPSDINTALESTIIVSSTEWKYFAELETQFEEDLPPVECVVGDINQVVLNMIVNAAHAIVERFDDPDKLEGRIIVSTKKAGENIHIEIGDNGNGIPDSVKNKIFDQFFTTKEVGKGTGQGLSIAYRLIVEGHEGKIEVDSAVGVGTTFRIILPIRQKNLSTAKSIDAA